jgi:arsenite methyltransferase
MSGAPALFARPDFQDAAGESLRPGGLDLTRRALALAGLKPGSRVLDLGCGPGATAKYLCACGHRVLALDLSRDFLARAAAPGVARLLANAQILPLADASLDAIFCECVLSLAADPAAALREAARVLAPGGALAVSDLYLRGPACGPSDLGAARRGDHGVQAGTNGPDSLPNLPETGRARASHDPDSGGHVGRDCLHGAPRREAFLANLDTAGFSLLAFEDHSRLLAELAGRLIFAGLPAASLASGCAPGAKPGYFLCLARRAGRE